jgi:hypothetical protein
LGVMGSPLLSKLIVDKELYHIFNPKDDSRV